MNWTVKNRLYLGCGTLVVLLAVACLIGWSQARRSQRNLGVLVDDANDNASLTAAAAAAVQQLQIARRHEREFLFEKKTAQSEDVTRALDACQKQLTRIGEDSDVGGNNPKYRAAVDAAAQYRKAFERVAELLNTRGLTPETGLEGAMRKATHEVEKTVNDQGIAELQVLLLMCRRHEKDYLMRRDPKYLGEVDKRIAEFAGQMNQFSLPGPIQTTAKKQLAAYRDALAGIIALDAEITVTLTTAQESATRFGQALSDVSAAVGEHTAASQRHTVAAMSTSTNLLLWVLGLGVTIGAVIAVWLSRAITAPISRAIHGLENSADETSSAASQVSNASQSLANGASEQAASLEETSASLEEISSMARQSADSAGKAKSLATETRNAAETGSTHMGEMKQAMDAIKESSSNIAKIVKSIDEIAFQTNILALNAAVEAARAGEAGAGFAVVAEEVRNLAQRSAQAARETAQRIEDSIVRSENGVRISARVAENFEEIVGKARQVDQLIGEIASAAQEQTQGIGQVGTALTQMDKVTQGNAASAEESASAAEQLNAQAEFLRDAVQNLSRFIGLRAAGRNLSVSDRAPGEHAQQLPANAAGAAPRASHSAVLTGHG